MPCQQVAAGVADGRRGGFVGKNEGLKCRMKDTKDFLRFSMVGLAWFYQVCNYLHSRSLCRSPKQPKAAKECGSGERVFETLDSH